MKYELYRFFTQTFFWGFGNIPSYELPPTMAELLSTPKGSYNAGLFPEWVVKGKWDEIISGLDSHFAADAWKEWDPKRVDRFEDGLVDKIIQSDKELARTIRWESDRVIPQKMIDRAAENPDVSGEVLLNFKNLEGYHDQLVESVLTSPAACLSLLSHKRNLGEYEVRIAKVAVSDPAVCLQAGHTYTSGFYVAVKGYIFEGVFKDIVTTIKTRQWPLERFLGFVERTTIGKVLQRNPVHYYLADRMEFDLYLADPTTHEDIDQAFELAEKYGALPEFFHGLVESLDRRCVKEWSKSILDHYKAGTIGGGNYREVFR